MTAAISADGIRQRYGDVQAVDGVSLTVEAGEFYGILGPNGAGKTTTMEILEGVRKPDEGRIELLGMQPWPRNPKLLPRIGVQFQATAFFRKLTARETIRTFASFYGVGPRRADAMLERVGLVDKAETVTDQMSGGQAQRLSIACALAHDPELVFLDEPTTGLDPQSRRNLWDLLRDINAEGRTVVLTTHYLDEAEVLCDRVSIMDHGKILHTGAPTALIREIDDTVRISVASGQLPLDRARELLTTAGADIATLEDDTVSLSVSTRLPAPVLTVLAEQNALRGLEVRGATLEDVFLQLTGREFRA
ncbi:ABC transporter ATP-binding protein [Streptomyces sp. CBMA156]|uniref:ABC transporter ATP-binding protein n=1 Tax=Streptomyces sp. CBMA156 TaxID=1930280 RepID=UPI001661B815|nr:ABC transporter ATP-binding protein [Streptomyces sp. CBMA156]MBD0672319.1 ABC transporter [Streptomyces sp. CBMA156]